MRCSEDQILGLHQLLYLNLFKLDNLFQSLPIFLKLTDLLSSLKLNLLNNNSNNNPKESLLLLLVKLLHLKVNPLLLKESPLLLNLKLLSQHPSPQNQLLLPLLLLNNQNQLDLPLLQEPELPLLNLPLDQLLLNPLLQ